MAAFWSRRVDIACLQAPLVTNGASSMLAQCLPLNMPGCFVAFCHGWPVAGLYCHWVARPMFPSRCPRRCRRVDGHNVTEGSWCSAGPLWLSQRRHPRPTYEDAPETISVWMPQRTLVQGLVADLACPYREPALLWRELGPASFLTTQIVFGHHFSTVHPIFVASVIYVLGQAAWADELAGEAFGLAAVGFINILCGYGVFILLGMATLLSAEKLRPLQLIAFTPVYWLLLSVAAWMALWEIYRRPHHWNKTPHRRRAIATSGETSN